MTGWKREMDGGLVGRWGVGVVASWSLQPALFPPASACIHTTPVMSIPNGLQFTAFSPQRPPPTTTFLKKKNSSFFCTLTALLSPPPSTNLPPLPAGQPCVRLRDQGCAVPGAYHHERRRPQVPHLQHGQLRLRRAEGHLLCCRDLLRPGGSAP